MWNSLGRQSSSSNVFQKKPSHSITLLEFSFPPKMNFISYLIKRNWPKINKLLAMDNAVNADRELKSFTGLILCCAHNGGGVITSTEAVLFQSKSNSDQTRPPNWEAPITITLLSYLTSLPCWCPNSVSVWSKMVKFELNSNFSQISESEITLTNNFSQYSVQSQRIYDFLWQDRFHDSVQMAMFQFAWCRVGWFA